MGHESRIELWLPLTTVLLVSFRADWLRREEAMKTAERENRNRWVDMFSVCANGTAGQNRPSLSTWGWKQEKLRRWERCFLLTSPSIERLRLNLRLLCKQGVAGSIPATSTNHIRFNEISLKCPSHNPATQAGGQGFEPPPAHQPNSRSRNTLR